MKIVLPCEQWGAENKPKEVLFELTTSVPALVKLFGEAPAGMPSMDSMLATLPPIFMEAQIGLCCAIRSPEALTELAGLLLDAAARIRIAIANQEMEELQEQRREEDSRLTEDEISELEEGKDDSNG